MKNTLIILTILSATPIALRAGGANDPIQYTEPKGKEPLVTETDQLTGQFERFLSYTAKKECGKVPTWSQKVSLLAMNFANQPLEGKRELVARIQQINDLPAASSKLPRLDHYIVTLEQQRRNQRKKKMKRPPKKPMKTIPGKRLASAHAVAHPSPGLTVSRISLSGQRQHPTG